MNIKTHFSTAFCCLLAGFLIGIPSIAANTDEDQASFNRLSETVALAPPSTATSSDRFDCQRRKGPIFTDEQLEKMSALKDQFHQSTASQKAELRTLKHRMRDLMLASEVDRSQVMSLQTKINSLRSELSTRFVSYKLDEMALLTPDQKQELRHRMLVHSFFGHHRWHHHGQGKDGGHRA